MSRRTPIDATNPVAGHYRARLRSRGVFVGVRLFHGPPADPLTGEPLDRAWRWQAEINGEPADFDNVWPACAAAPITSHEYANLCRRQAWARIHAPDGAHADPTRKRDPLSTREALPF
jgi:hypothetical protein